MYINFLFSIVDVDSGTTLVGPNAPGELWLRSKCVMKGYLNDEAETRLCIDGDRWFHTGEVFTCKSVDSCKFLGDIAYFDEDGFYFIVGRLKNMIKVNGMQVSPVELVRDFFNVKLRTVHVRSDSLRYPFCFPSAK